MVADLRVVGTRESEVCTTYRKTDTGSWDVVSWNKEKQDDTMDVIMRSVEVMDSCTCGH